MPINVTCPICDATFTVKESFAGKRGECPDCGEPITVPEAPPVKERNNRGKTGRSSRTLLILIGLTLLIGGGGCAGLFFVYLLPAFKEAEANREQKRSAKEAAEKDNLTQTKLSQIRAGMSLAEVEAVFGRGEQPTDADVVKTSEEFRDSFEVEGRWVPQNRLGRVGMWARNGDTFLVAFSADPDTGGTVVGTLGGFDRPHHQGIEPIRLPGEAPPVASNPNPKPLDPTTFPDHPVATLTATALAKDFEKYKGQWVIVRGKVKTGTRTGPDDEYPRWDDLTLEQDAGEPVQFIQRFLDACPALDAGEVAEVWGRVSDHSEVGDVGLVDCLLWSHTTVVDAGELMAEFVTNEQKAEKKYQNKTLKITGLVRKEFEVLKLVAKVGDEEWLISSPDLSRAGARPGDRATILACGVEYWSPSSMWRQRIHFKSDRAIAISR